MPNDVKPADGVRGAVSELITTCVWTEIDTDGTRSLIKADYSRADRIIAALVAEVRLQDAKAVCPMCRDGEEYGTLYMMDVVKSGGYWCHRNVGGRGLVPCRALPIHDLLKETEENE